jgi:hypothetical protein
MSSRQIIRALWLAAGLSILVLLMIPAVHLPCVVIHGPATALRAQRAASLVIFLMQAAAFLFAGRVSPMFSERTMSMCRRAIAQFGAWADVSLNCALRC